MLCVIILNLKSECDYFDIQISVSEYLKIYSQYLSVLEANMEFSTDDVKEMWSALVRSKTDSSLPETLYDVQIDALQAILNRKHLFFVIPTGN